MDMLSGMTRISFSPLAAATKARAMPVLPLVGSTMVAVLDQALGLQGLDHRDADAVLHRGQGIEELQLGDHLALGLQLGGQPRQADQRRVADGVEDGVEDLAPAGALVAGGVIGLGGQGPWRFSRAAAGAWRRDLMPPGIFF